MNKGTKVCNIMRGSTRKRYKKKNMVFLRNLRRKMIKSTRCSLHFGKAAMTKRVGTRTMGLWSLQARAIYHRLKYPVITKAGE